MYVLITHVQYTYMISCMFSCFLLPWQRYVIGIGCVGIEEATKTDQREESVEPRRRVPRGAGGHPARCVGVTGH